MDINDRFSHIPKALMNQSGSVFYSGANAFTGTKSLYVLGINPGGSIETQAAETVAWHTDKVLNDMPADWSAYRDESWAGKVPGTVSRQPELDRLFQTTASGHITVVLSTDFQNSATGCSRTSESSVMN